MSPEQVPASSNSRKGGVVVTRALNFQGFGISSWGRLEVLVLLNYDLLGRSIPIGKITMQHPTAGTNLFNFWFRYEIVCEESPFLSTFEKWGVHEETDAKYWGKFKAFEEYRNTFTSPSFDYKSLAESNYVFMRWKSDAPISQFVGLESSPFSHFYYVCLTKTTGDIEAYYCDENPEMYHTIDIAVYLPCLSLGQVLQHLPGRETGSSQASHARFHKIALFSAHQLNAYAIFYNTII
uniref:Uncharacterized protein n=1 Tax=Glossina pallidipes TaxID=7398 RepID=A0A1A9ZIE1_GLOPL